MSAKTIVGIGLVAALPAGALMSLVFFIMMFTSSPPADDTDSKNGGGGSSGGGSSAQVGSCAPKCPGPNGPQHQMNVQAAIASALSEVGTSRPTGWDMPGECMKSVQRWVAAGGGYFAPGMVVSGYLSSPAIRVTDGSLRPGDVIQYTNTANPEMFGYGVHTFMIIAVNGDGTFDLVESNNPGGSGLVGVRTHTTAPAPPGWESYVWRFAATA